MPLSQIKTILAVDDTVENIDVIKGVLSGEDFKVKAATNGEMAMRIAQNDPPDLILLDIMMPGMDGYEVCSRLRSLLPTHNIPIIFVTAKLEEEDEKKGFEAGAVDYITKPIKPGILLARVRTHLLLHEARVRLADQNEKLVQAARMRDDVEHIMRHDLKSPLNMIAAVPQLLLLDDNLTEGQRTWLKNIEDSAWRMLSMIDMSLNLLKMEYGTYEPRREPMDVLAPLKRVLLDLDRYATSKAVRFEVFVDGSPMGDEGVVVSSEEMLVYSLMSNLLKNATEAAPEGDTVTINVRTANGVDIAIDNGGTVPEEIRDTFFDKFVTAEKINGTGLGTYSAKLIVETLGGEIELDTSHEQRTMVRFSLPDFE